MFPLRGAAALAAGLLLSACSVFEEPPPPFPEPPPGAHAAPPPRPEPSTPGQVQTAIYRWFLAAGYQPFQAAALVDHARIESGLHPCIAGPGGLRYTYQWSGTRLQRLHVFAETNGCPPLDKQLAFADRELRHEEKFSCFLRTTTREAAVAALRRGFGRGSC
jgi:hypothetical protein